METQIIFDGSKGKLFGVIHFSEKEKSPGVILFHGFTGNKCESHFLFTKFARRLCKEGISILRFDFYGSGDSEGNFYEMTLESEMEDGVKAVEFMKSIERIDKEKIGVVGLSMGAVIGTFVSFKFPEIKAVALWSPLAFPKIIKKKILTKKLKEKILNNGKVYIPGIGHYLSKEFFDSLEKISIEKFAENYKGRVLIIHTKDDSALDIKHPLFYFEKFHENASDIKMVILEKGGHTFVTEESENRVIEETTEFFVETFKKE